MSPTEQLRYKNMEDFGYGPNVMKKTKVCPKCGKMVNTRFRSCPDCGEQLSSETLFDHYKRQHACCSECDTVLTDDSKFCPHCGKSVFKNLQNYQINTSKGGTPNET